MQRAAADADAGIGLQVDLGFLLPQCQHLGVDSAAFNDDLGKAGIFIGFHREDLRIQGRILFSWHTDLHIGDTVKPLGGIQVTDRIKPPGEAGDNPARHPVVGRGQVPCQRLLQLGRGCLVSGSLVQCGQPRRPFRDEISVLGCRDGFQISQLGGDGIPLALQLGDGIGKPLGLAGGNLHPVLGQQEFLLCVQNAGIVAGIQLIQKIVQGRPGLGGQQRKVAAAGILRTFQQ